MVHNSMKKLAVALIIALLTATTANAQYDFEDNINSLIENTQGLDNAGRLHKLFEVSWEYQMHEFPEWATYIGYPGQNDRWTDRSLEAIERRNGHLELPGKVLAEIDRDKLNQDDRLNYDLFSGRLDDQIDGIEFRGELMPINQLGGIQQDIAQLLSIMPAGTISQCEDILARLRTVPKLVDQTLALMKEGLKKGLTPPRVTMVEVPQQVRNQIVENPAEAPMLVAIKQLPESMSEIDKTRIRSEAHAIYSDKIVPAFEELHSFLTHQYLPDCREGIGWSSLPDGKKWYAYLCRHYTSTRLSPDSIFNIGRSEVQRIRSLMDSVIKSTEFEGNFYEFCDFLRTDEQFFFDEPNELLQAYRDICKRADPELIKLFGQLPRLPYGIEPVPSYAEKSQTTAYYMGGSLEAGRPGIYFANTYDLKSRPKWEMEALSLHEAVPGHHLQISIAQELEGLPEFRRRGWYTAYGEGWGLYSESLGEEMGFYKDPYSKFGQLTYEMWRAIRLVVDVGMHDKGWTRQDAIDFFTANVGKADHDIEVEVDRYIVMPGQALAYKIGELKIKKLRAYVTEQLGEKFDIRAFHDELLGNGPLPLDVLESNMKEWVKAQSES